MTGCGRAPAFDILGSFFPGWLVCLVVAILLTFAARALLNRYVEIAWPVLVYPSLTAAFCLRIVARSLPVNFMTTEPLDKEMVTKASRNHGRKFDGAKSERRWRKPLGRWISIVIVAAAVILGLVVLYHENYYPRTEDAEIFANFIGIAPQVDGPLIRLNVKDNQFVKKGELLYEIDERPYQYALENAVSEQALWKGKSRTSNGE